MKITITTRDDWSGTMKIQNRYHMDIDALTLKRLQQMTDDQLREWLEHLTKQDLGEPVEQEQHWDKGQLEQTDWEVLGRHLPDPEFN